MPEAKTDSEIDSSNDLPGEKLTKKNVEDAEFLIKILPGGDRNGYEITNVEGSGVKTEIKVKQKTGQQEGDTRYLYPFGMCPTTIIRKVKRGAIE